jgi:hypothetical protein
MIDKFISKYRLPLLSCILHDPEIDLKLFHQNNLVRIQKFSERTLPVKSDPQGLPEDILSDCIQKKRFDQIESGHYILTEKELAIISKYSKDFSQLSRLSTVMWSDEIIERYSHLWNWSTLSANHSIDWNEQRISKFEHLIDFKFLSFNSTLTPTRSFLDKHSDQWDWSAISGSPSIAKRLGKSLFSQKNLIWKTPTRVYNWKIENTARQFEFNSYAMYSGCDVPPSVSTNAIFEWSVEDFEEHKSKLDWWALAYYGKLDHEILFNHWSLFDENRVHHTEFHRVSDWHDQHPYHINGWKNVLCNRNIFIDLKLLKFINTRSIKRIYYTGDARDGFQEQSETIPIIDLGFSADRLVLSFEEICSSIDLLPKTLIRDCWISEEFWKSHLRKVFLQRPSLINDVCSRI